MATVLLVVHLMIAVALVGVVLVQKSEGGGLGIGGGGGGGFLTGRGTASFLTRTTAGLAAAFFITSMALTMIAQKPSGAGSLLDRPAAATPTPTQPAAPTDGATAPPAGAGRGGVLDKLEQGEGRTRLPEVPRQ